MALHNSFFNVTSWIFILTITMINNVNCQQRTNRMRPPFNPAGGFARFPMTPNSFAPMPFMSNPLLAGAGLGGPGMYQNPYLSPYQQGNPNFFSSFGGPQQQQEEIYTAIGFDRMDPNSQMRITITERGNQRSGMRMNPMMPGSMFPGMDMEFGYDFNDYDTPTSWYVQGAFIGSQLSNKAGTYHLVLTTSGRTADGCVSESLGMIASPDMVDINNPFLQQTASSGVLPNPVLVGSSGPTVYASTLEGISRRQLVGAGLAACQYINNGVCGGYIPFCATINKDILPAMEVPVGTGQSTPTTVVFDPLGFQQGQFLSPAAPSTLAFPENGRNPPTAAQQKQRQTPDDIFGLLF